MEKRKRRSRASTGTPAAKRSKPQWSRTVFGQMMEEAGLNLGGNRENELAEAPALFQRKLAQAFKSKTNIDKAVEDFISSLAQYCDDPARFRMTLLPTNIATGADIVTRLGGLDSVMRLLLGVEILQPAVIDTLLEKLPEYMDDEGEMEGMGLLEYHQMAKLILNQFRWLDHLVNGKDLCSKLLEVAGVAPVELQREIITALPEILDDPQHNDAAVELKSLLQTKYDLTAAIIDSLSNLTISNETAAEVLDVAINCLQSADLADLPTVIKFIMQYVTAKNAQELISELRVKLDLDTSPLPMISSTPLETQAASRKHDSETSDHYVVFDTIQKSICFHKSVADGWIKAIQSVSQPNDHRPIDLFVLFILYSVPARKKSVVSLFSEKIKAKCFTDDLMNSVFGSHTGALREYFLDILTLCENLLCSSSPSVSLFAASLYQHLFASFDKYCQQEVIGNLIIHISNGVSSEVNHALDILTSLVERQQKEVSHFTILIKGALDYLEHFTVPQLRKIYRILSTLAFHDLDEGGSLQNELKIIIRKQLSHDDTKYRHMGIIGSVMVIRQIAHKVDVSDMTMNGALSTQPNTRLSETRKEQSKHMLDDVIKSCANSAESMILFCEEMSSVVESLDHEILSHLSEQVTSQFQDDFLIEITDSLPNDLGLPLEFLHSLDTSEDGSIAVNLVPMIIGGEERKKDSLRGMAAQFKLVRVCELALQNNLEGIDALLGCSVVMCATDQLERDAFEELPLEKRHDICLSIFHCLNWFRELVCAFASESDPDMKGKVIIRLGDITQLQDTLETCMTLAPGFWPPCVNVSETVQPTKAKKGGKSSKSEVTLASITAATINVDKDTTVVDKAAASTPAVPIDRLRPYFRELDLGVFTCLNYGSLSRTLLDSENHTREREELQINPPQLLFLLQDLYNKLSSTLSVFGPKGNKTGVSCTADELVTAMTTLVSPLCEQLENTSAFFQAQLAENDGMIDVDCHHKDYPHMVLCFHLLLKSLATFFAWSSLSDPLYADSLKKILEAMVTRTSQSFSQGARTLQDLAKKACQYLQRFKEFLPTLTCAHSLAKVVVVICKTCKANHVKQMISTNCGEMLQRPWRVTESRQLRDDALDYLLKYHIEWASQPLDIIETIAGKYAVELIGEDAQETSQVYPTLTSATFSCYYRAMITALVNRVKSIPAPSKTNEPSADDLEDRLHVLELSAKVLYILVNLVKSFDKKQVLAIVLKNGRKYVDAFLKSGMPVLNLLFRPRQDDVIALLKTVQQSTRCLHHFCGHSKVEKDTRLVNHIPQLKKSLEILVFRVKELMVKNNCRDAFQVGNLKNRNIKGEEILSQMSQQSGETGEEEDESGDEEEEGGSTSTDRRSRDEILDSDSESD